MKFLDVIRYSEWWVYKLCPLLAIGYATILMLHAPFLQTSIHFIFLLACMAVGAAYVCVINDITDMKEDLACGKRNRMIGVPARVRWLLPVACLLIGGVFSVYFLLHDLLSFGLYVMACVSFSLYSFEPFRLKKRRFWGVLADASGSHLFPSLFFVSAMSHFIGQPINWFWFTAVGVWALCYGIRGILWHQFRDRDNDRKVGINTFAGSISPQQFITPGVLIFCVEAIALLAMLYMVGAITCIIFLVLYAAVVLVRYKLLGQQVILIQTPPSAYFQILMIDYYQVFLPLSLLVVAVSLQVNAVWILLIHILLFPQKIWCIFKDMFLAFRRFFLQRA